MTARFSNVIVTEKIGETPAAVNRKTGVLFINPVTFGKLSPDEQRFVVLHELGHLHFDTKSELLADKAALFWYIHEGRPLSYSFLTLANVLDKNNKSHQLRMKNLAKELSAFDKKVNFKNTTNSFERMNNIQNAFQNAQKRWVFACANGDVTAAQKAAHDIVSLLPMDKRDKAALNLNTSIELLKANHAQDNFCASCNGFDDEYGENDFDGEDDENEFDGSYLEGFSDADILGFSADMNYMNPPKKTKNKGGFQKVFGAVLETVGSAAGIKAVADAGSRIREKGLQKSAAAGNPEVGVPDPRQLIAEQQKAEAEQKQKEEEEKRKKEAEEKKKKMWMIGGGIVALILIALAIWFFTRKKA